MKTELMEAMAAGVFVEVRDLRGNTLGQAVFADWRGRPLPAVGDTLCCTLQGTGARGPRQVRGAVVARQFDVQLDDRGETCVWVLIVVELALHRLVRTPTATFSEN